MALETLFEETPQGPPRVITLASAKGGMGTTLLAANLAIVLAKKGKNVLLVDGALTEGSCHLALGMMRPNRHIGSIATKEVADISQAVVQTPVANLSLLAGSPDVVEAANIPYLTKQKVLAWLRQSPYDVVLVDSGSGTGADTLDFVLAGDIVLVVAQAQPPALEPFYRFVRAFLHRLLANCLNKKRYQALQGKLNWLSPLDGFNELEESTESDIATLEESVRSRRFAFVLTGLQNDKDARLGGQIEMLLRRYFLAPFKFLGGVEWDGQAQAGALAMEPISKAYPMCAFSMSVEKLANILLKDEAEFWPAQGPLEANAKEGEASNAYALLDLPFSATAKDIQNAYTRKLEPYLETSPLTVGLLSKEQREAIRDGFEQAYKTLINSGLRQRYDEDLIARGLMAPEERIQEYREAASESPALFSANADSPSPAEDTQSRAARSLEAILQEVKYFDGAGLRKVREAQKISIEEIVSETNIRAWYVESIEGERYDALPALIYLKGFLRQIAAYLHVEPVRVLSDYLERYQHWAERQQ